MATYFLDSAAAGAGTGADWTNAFTTYAAALAAATSNGDVIKVDDGHTEELAADTTYTHAANISVICVDKGNSDALSTMGTAAWIGNSTTNRTVSLSGGKAVYFRGITFRTAGATADALQIATGDGAHHEFEFCYFYQGNTSTSAHILIGLGDAQVYVRARECTWRFGATGQGIEVAGHADIEGGTIAGSAITTIIRPATIADPGGGVATITGMDLTGAATTANLVGDATRAKFSATFRQCKLPSSYVLLAAQTVTNKSSAELFVYDCANGDTHTNFAHADALGSTVIDSGIYFTSSAAALSWKIVTTAAASFYYPYRSPWFKVYNTATSAVTPYVEVLRDGSATAYNDDEAWLEFFAKVTSGVPQSTFYSDRKVILASGAAQANGAGLGSWTGESGTAKSTKLDTGASLTPAEVGDFAARVCVGVASTTLYVDPFIRT